MSWALIGLGVLGLAGLGYVAGRWGPSDLAPTRANGDGPHYPLTVFTAGALDERVVDEVVASTLHAVPRGVAGIWDTADIVAVPLRLPGGVLHRVGGRWQASTIHWLPTPGDPLRRCVEMAAMESPDWSEWLNRRLKHQ